MPRIDFHFPPIFIDNAVGTKQQVHIAYSNIKFDHK